MTNHYINTSDSKWLKSISSWKTKSNTIIDWNTGIVYSEESSNILSKVADKAKDVLDNDDLVGGFNSIFK